MKRFTCYTVPWEFCQVAIQPLVEELERRGWNKVGVSEPRDIAFIVVGDDAQPEYMAMSPMVWYPHGLGPAKWVFPQTLTNSGAEMPSLLLLSGPFYEQRLFREPVVSLRPSVNYAIVGWAKMDAFFQGRVKPADLPHPVIVFAPTWGSEVGTAEFADDVTERLSGLGTLVILPHPGVAWEFGEANLVRVADIRPYLLAADVVISGQSSVAVEAACLDKPVVHLLEHWLRRGWSGKDGEPFLVGHPATLATLRQDVEDALAHPGRYSFLRRYWAEAMLAYPGEGARRAADAVEQVFGGVS